MAYNPYGAQGNPYGAPPSYGGFPGAGAAPGMAPPPGLGPPPGMSSAPGMAPPPGVQQSNNAQANRQSGLPSNFQAPNIPTNFDFSAPVIRLSALGGAKPGPSGDSGGRRDNGPPSGRQGLGMERESRGGPREHMQSLMPPSAEERLRTIFIHKIPESLNTDESIERLLNAAGRLRRWESAASTLPAVKGAKFGFATYDDIESFETAAEILQDVQVPKTRQKIKSEPAEDEAANGVEMVKLQVAVDPNSLKYIESHKENHAEDPGAASRLQAARDAVKQVLDELAHPKKTTATDGDGDATMGNNGGDVEVVNIPLAQDDELADIPAEMREVVAAEIASFRDRSIRRDMERLKREEEMEEQERNRNAPPRRSRLDTPPPENTPSGPRVPNAPAGPRGSGDRRGSVSFVNGGVYNADGSLTREDEESEADDEELHKRHMKKKNAEDDKRYHDAEHKWHNRERARQAALERERDREQQEDESLERRRAEQLEREKAWDDERERDRKSHLYYRDHAAWVRKRQQERAEEASRDEQDRRAEEEERRREAADTERARGMADSFLNQQAHEIQQRQQQTSAAAAPAAPFKLSLGAAAQRAQASRTGPARRTMAEVEGLLDDEEQDGTAKRQLIPIQFEPTTAADKMTEEELSNAVRALAQEIPSDKDGLWGWSVAWDHLDDGVIREKLRPFVEKKIVEYLGVQEELLVEVVEEHLRKHGKPDALVEELTGALDDEAEDMVKKLWRMVIFFTESEKRGYAA
ncbi:hypothetical protein F5X68DRAFT_209454 [Plectosphaerella plurivora]|uniref:PWI domain-containing protein n=1 Tax=Plectosphaerella plurivora TaxID=936078 RepID=A0A9P8VBF0_9PEZI|nr:hypothetical protein F5X68DRAFT_209454 [Plectosphaerella plurivora]